MTRGNASAAVPLPGIMARWDALAIRWGLDGEERSALLGGVALGPEGEGATYVAATAQRRMRLLVALDPIVMTVLGDEARIRAWLRRPNANLGGSAPIEVMTSSPEWIRWLIDALGVAA